MKQCLGKCNLNFEDDSCTGCGRTAEEIASDDGMGGMRSMPPWHENHPNYDKSKPNDKV